MNRTVIALGLLVAAAGLAGCSTQSTLVAGDEPAIYLAEFGPSVSAASTPQPQFYLGAGDALGQALFMHYVASLKGIEQSGEMFAVGADPRPE